MAGDPGHPAAEGPAVVTAALAEVGCGFPVHRVAIRAFGGDARAASIDVARRVADVIRDVVASGDRPMVISGSCDVAPAVFAGVGDDKAGVVWIDAHADFNTPESSASGFWPGMALAVLVGDCGAELWSALGSRPVPSDRVSLFGVRSLSPPEEARRLERSAIRVVGWRDGEPDGDVGTALDDLAGKVERVYVHLDLDALDPTIGSGVVDPPVPGGLSERQLLALVDELRKRFELIGATIATYTPANDEGATRPVAVAVVRRLISDRAEPRRARRRA